ncbi:MAG: TonB C-terminal domain-containing protein [Deltaproteobacteria bacterium]|nr:TonB C-terminal domain-containing protein [Deltaproteobacteria bacterium]
MSRSEPREIRTPLAQGWGAWLEIVPGVVISLAAHGVVAVVGLVLSYLVPWLWPDRPMVDPDQAIEVSMVVLPKSRNALPDRAMRAPREAGVAAPAEVSPEEAPVRESDLAFPQPAPQPKGHPNADLRRDEMMADIERERLLQDLTAATGDYDRDASDPNSNADFALNTGAQGDPADPEYARYIMQLQQLFMQHFRPLPGIAQSNPGIRAEVYVIVDPDTGAVKEFRFKRSSNNEAYDRAAELAVQEVGTIPLPPEKYLHLAKGGYVIQFDPPRR